MIGFPNWWDNTLVRLNELLRVTPRADNRLIAVEGIPDRELETLAAHDLATRSTALDGACPCGR